MSSKKKGKDKQKSCYIFLFNFKTFCISCGVVNVMLKHARALNDSGLAHLTERVGVYLFLAHRF